MSSGLAQVTARRIWFVPQFQVWGQSGLGAVDCLLLEQTGSAQGIFFFRQMLGEPSQTVRFEDLVDHRGNMLPSSINNPRVIIRDRSDRRVWIVGSETSESFRIARDMAESGPATVDLFVIELGP